MSGIRLAGMALVLAGLVGCGGGPRMAPVAGKVTYPDGSPLPGGSLVLIPNDPEWPSAMAEIATDGTFTVYTAKPGDGARVGSYKVAIMANGEDYSAKNPRPLDQKYSDHESSGLTCTVEDKSNTLNLTITRPGQKK